LFQSPDALPYEMVKAVFPVFPLYGKEAGPAGDITRSKQNERWGLSKKAEVSNPEIEHP
jgi:hypothetical protein